MGLLISLRLTSRLKLDIAHTLYLLLLRESRGQPFSDLIRYSLAGQLRQIILYILSIKIKHF